MKEWQDLSEEQKKRIVSHITTFIVRPEDLDEDSGIKMINNRLAYQIGLETYMLIRGLTKNG